MIAFSDPTIGATSQLFSNTQILFTILSNKGKTLCMDDDVSYESHT